MKSGIFDFLLVIPISKSIIYLGDVLLNNIALGVILITILINIIILPLESKFAVHPVKATTNKTKQIILKYFLVLFLRSFADLLSLHFFIQVL